MDVLSSVVGVKSLGEGVDALPGLSAKLTRNRLVISALVGLKAEIGELNRDSLKLLNVSCAWSLAALFR